jgi:hypothetical protein
MNEVRDLAKLYLNKLQLGYRIEEKRLSPPLVGGEVVAANNPNRVLLYVVSPGSVVPFVGFKSPSGLLIPWRPIEGGIGSILITVKDHLVLPTWEWIVVQATADELFSVSLIKL